MTNNYLVWRYDSFQAWLTALNDGGAALLSRRGALAAHKKRRRVPNVWDAPPLVLAFAASLFFQHFRYNVHAFVD